MACEDEDKAKANPKNVVDIKYDDLPEEKRQAFEAQLKEMEAESKRRLHYKKLFSLWRNLHDVLWKHHGFAIMGTRPKNCDVLVISS